MHLVYHIHSAVCSCNCTCITTGSFTNISLNVVGPYRCRHLMLMKQNRSTNKLFDYAISKTLSLIFTYSDKGSHNHTLQFYSALPIETSKKMKTVPSLECHSKVREYNWVHQCSHPMHKCSSGSVFGNISHLQLFHYSFHIIYYSSRWP